MSATDATTDPELSDVAWDLSHLLDGAGRTRRPPWTRCSPTRSAAPTRSPPRTPASWRSSTAPGLVAAMHELEAIEELAGRAASYAQLSFSHRHRRPGPRRAAAARAGERHRRSRPRCCSSSSSGPRSTTSAPTRCSPPTGWTSRATTCAPPAATARTCCREPEEKILAEKALTGRSAWVRLFEEQASAIQVELDGEPSRCRWRSRSRACTRPTATVRRHAAERVTAALQPGLRTRAYAFNTLLADKMVDDRLRHYPHWLAARNLANEASDESVQALIDAVRNRYELPRRWYRLKAQLLGLDRLADYDRMAAVTHENEQVAWPEARDLVLDAYSAFSDELGALARRFFDERWIDAPVRPDKRGGAFCAYTVPCVHPYVMLNYTHRRRDVLTLAHELGHGVHAALGGRQGIFHMATPLTLAETASVFGETLMFGRLLEQAADAGVAAVAAGRVDRGLDRHRLPPGGDEPLRAPRAHRSAARGRAGRRPHRRAVGAVAGGAARRRGRGHRRLPLLVVLRAALHRLARLRLRLRVRPAARARGLRPLRGGGRRRSCPPTSSCCRPAARAAAGGAGRRSSASTSPTPASGTAGLDLVRAPARRRRGRPRARPAGSSRGRPGCSAGPPAVGEAPLEPANDRGAARRPALEPRHAGAQTT